MPKRQRTTNTQSSYKTTKCIGSARCNYDAEDLTNSQIMRELQAGHEYRSLVAWARYNNYFNCAKIFKEMQEDEMKHAEKWCNYQDERRGKPNIEELNSPISFDEIKGISHAFMIALEMEKTMNKCLNEFHEISDEMKDYHLSSFIDEFISDQITDQRELEAIVVFCNKFKNNEYDLDFKMARFLKTVKER